MKTEYFCEKCGVVVTKPFGSGRYCSRSCANSRQRPKSTRDKISQSVRKTLSTMDKSIFANKNQKEKIHNECSLRYLNNPSYCKVCGKQLTYDMRYRKTCSKECFTIQNSKNGGFKEGSVKNHKCGYYNGIRCDSSWELAFLVYHNDMGVNIKRNTKGFEYEFENSTHMYYPDFIVDDTYIEIKNYITPQVMCKMSQFPKNLKYKLLLYKDLKVYIDYCISHYGKRYWETLYD